MALGKNIKRASKNASRSRHTIKSPNLGMNTTVKTTKKRSSISGKAALSSLAKSYARTSKIVSAVNTGTNTARQFSTAAGRTQSAANSLARSVNSGKAVEKTSNPKSVNDLLSSNVSGTMYEDVANKNNALSVMMNREQNEYNAQQAAMQRSWEENMANSAHQREVADLKAAGLNPILSAGGQGAATPVGSNATSAPFSGVDESIVPALANLAATSIGANATMTAAATNAAATEAAAAMNSNAMMYGSDLSLQASNFAADKAYQANRYKADVAAGATKYATDVNAAAKIVGNVLGGFGLKGVLKK